MRKRVLREIPVLPPSRDRVFPLPLPQRDRSQRLQPLQLLKALPAARSRVSYPLQPVVSPTPRRPPERREPEVAIVPAETAIPLDRREPTLAEVMDLRKRYPIASIMGGVKEDVEL